MAGGTLRWAAERGNRPRWPAHRSRAVFEDLVGPPFPAVVYCRQ